MQPINLTQILDCPSGGTSSSLTLLSKTSSLLLYSMKMFQITILLILFVLSGVIVDGAPTPVHHHGETFHSSVMHSLLMVKRSTSPLESDAEIISSPKSSKSVVLNSLLKHPLALQEPPAPLPPLTTILSGCLPLVSQLSQCTCHEANSRIYLVCTGITDLDLLQKVLQSYTHFSALWLRINASELPMLAQRTFGGLTVEGLQINSSNVSQIADNAFVDMEHLKSLAVQDNRLTTIPVPALRRLLGLEMLSLAGNRITAIPAATFLGLPNLNYVSVAQNAISTVQKGCFGEGLRHLALSNNQITTLNGSVRNLPHLEWLLLTGNQLTSLENELINLPSLTMLNLGKNQLKHLKNAFNDLYHLKSLNLSYNEVEYLDSAAFEGLSGLRTLDLSGNFIANITTKGFLKPLQSLQRLHVSDNYIENFEIEDANSLMNLHLLDLSKNRLVHFGKRNNHPLSSGGLMLLHRKGLVQRLAQLEHLILSDNRLNSLDDELHHLPSLTHLHLDRNYLRQIQDQFVDLPRLQVLNLSRNEIDRITTSPFRQLTNLVELDLSHNRLHKIHGGTFDHLNNLQVLNVSHNQLDYLEENLFEHFHSLVELDLSYNGIATVNSHAFNHLHRLLNLNLASNRLQSVRDSLQPLHNLQNLILSDNALAVVDGDDFLPLTTLQYLDLSRNQLTAIGLNTQLSLPSLLGLWLSNNRLISLQTALNRLPNLRELDLRHNQLSQLMKDTFSHNPNLRTLQIQGNPWTCDAHFIEALLQLERNATQIDDKPWCINAVM